MKKLDLMGRSLLSTVFNMPDPPKSPDDPDPKKMRK